MQALARRAVIVTAGRRDRVMAIVMHDGTLARTIVKFVRRVRNGQENASEPILPTGWRVIVATGFARRYLSAQRTSDGSNADKPVDCEQGFCVRSTRRILRRSLLGTVKSRMSVDDFGNHVGCSYRKETIETTVFTCGNRER